MDLNVAIYIFLPIYFLASASEALYSYFSKKGLYHGKDTLANLFFGLSGVLTRTLTKGLWLSFWIYLYQFAPLKLPPNLWTYIALFFLNELVYYWFHRLSHEIRFLWAVHVNHHSSEMLNFTTAARIPFFNFIFHNLFWIPLLFLGFSPTMIFQMEIISFLFAFVQHTRVIKNFSIFDHVLNSPSHHRVHHASNEEYINKNYGNVLIIYDKLFGTFQKEKPEIKIKYGLTKNVNSYNPVKLVFHEWIDMFKSKKNTV